MYAPNARTDLASAVKLGRAVLMGEGALRSIGRFRLFVSLVAAIVGAALIALPAIAATPTLPGIDVSHHNGDTRLEPGQGRWGPLRRGQGDRGHDLRARPIHHEQAGVEAQAIPSTAYHFARPDKTAGDAIAEADWFVANAQLTGTNLVPVLDLEDRGGLGVKKLKQWTKAWLGGGRCQARRQGDDLHHDAILEVVPGQHDLVRRQRLSAVDRALDYGRPAGVARRELGRPRLDVVAVHQHRLCPMASTARSTRIATTDQSGAAEDQEQSVIGTAGSATDGLGVVRVGLSARWGEEHGDSSVGRIFVGRLELKVPPKRARRPRLRSCTVRLVSAISATPCARSAATVDGQNRA